jgi:GNAT superfamily N-acetyltransferase
MGDWSNEIERARQIYNESLAVLPDFVAVTTEDFARQCEPMRSIVDQDLLLFVEVDGRAVGFAVALPDINQALRFGSGLRAPWDWARVWWHRRKIDCVSFKVLALLPAYHRAGLGSLLYRELATKVIQRGYTWMDLSLTGEDNPQTNRIAPTMGAQIYKRYRTYELPLRRLDVEVTQ